MGCQFIVRPYTGFEIVHCKRFSIENFLNWQFLGDLRQRFGQEHFLSPGDDDYEGRLPVGCQFIVSTLGLCHDYKSSCSPPIIPLHESYR